MSPRTEKIIGVFSLLFIVSVFVIVLVGMEYESIASVVAKIPNLLFWGAVILAPIIGLAPSVIVVAQLTLIILILRQAVPSLRVLLAQWTWLDIAIFAAALMGFIAAWLLCAPSRLSCSTLFYVGGVIASSAMLITQLARTALNPKRKVGHALLLTYAIVIVLLFGIVETNAKVRLVFLASRPGKEAYIQQVRNGAHSPRPEAQIYQTNPTIVLFEEASSRGFFETYGYLYSEISPAELTPTVQPQFTKEAQLAENWWWVKVERD